ncbi:NUDIX hydrolase [Spirochaeta cellobiosiphila]|uniref:NUDIX hydrolase n=1 Tax=Spirochaeta cellobiosiphila TaxID=504483 RepID=UPI0004910260|nr:NUDIX hydrolase [Spirochaeta cellobiosiphila]
MKWKTQKSEYIVQSDFLTLRADSCELPNGTLIDPCYVLEFPRWANVLPLTKDNQVILVKQYRHGVQETYLEIPGGIVEEGEDLLEGIKRELLEETGYSGGSFKQISAVAANPAVQNNMTYGFIATGLEKTHKLNLDDTEDLELVLMPLEEFYDRFKKGEFVHSLLLNTIFYGLIDLGLIKLS